MRLRPSAVGGGRGGAHQVGVGDVGPGGDVVDAVAVLPHHSVADVRKFAVLKDQEVCVTGAPTRQEGDRGRSKSSEQRDTALCCTA